MSLFEDRKAPLIQLFRQVVFALGAIEVGQIVQPCSDQWMVGTQCCLSDFDCSLVQRLGLGKEVLSGVERGGGVEWCGVPVHSG